MPEPSTGRLREETQDLTDCLSLGIKTPDPAMAGKAPSRDGALDLKEVPLDTVSPSQRPDRITYPLT